MMLRDRVDRVVAAINRLGPSPEIDDALPGDPAFAAAVTEWQRRTGVNEVFAAGWQLLERSTSLDAGGDRRRLRSLVDGSHSDGHSAPDTTPHDRWIERVARLFAGPSTSRRPTTTQVSVSLTTHPHLVDHSIDATPVVPVVQVIEWFARAAAAHSPHLHLFELTGLQVLKGLVVEGFHDGASLDLVVSATVTDPVDRAGGTAADTVLALELVDPSTGRKHYRCTARLSPDRPLPGRSSEEFSGLEPDRRARVHDPVYGGEVLFHGPTFQVLSSIHSLGRPGSSDVDGVTGLVASVTGVIERSWPAEPWATDPAMFDGGLQLASLWTERLLGGASLPTSIGCIRVFGSPLAGSHRNDRRTSGHGEQGDVRRAVPRCGRIARRRAARCGDPRVATSARVMTAAARDRLDVWLERPGPMDDAAIAAAEETLSDDERRRHRRFVRAEDRELFLTAHVLVRRTLSRYAPVAPGRWTFGAGAYGRPEVTNEVAPPGLCFNLSHTVGLIAVGVIDGVEAAPMGVDVERIGRVADPLAIAARVFAAIELEALSGLSGEALELAFTRIWTLKESFIKATGMGLAMPLQQFWFDITDPAHPRFGCDPAIDPDPQAWSFTLHRPSAQHVLATAQRHAAAPSREVRLLDATATDDRPMFREPDAQPVRTSLTSDRLS